MVKMIKNPQTTIYAIVYCLHRAIDDCCVQIKWLFFLQRCISRSLILTNAMSVNTLYKDTTCIHNVSTLHFILYKLPTPQRSVTEMVGKQTSQPDGNKLLLGCHDCLPRTKYKESSNSKHNLSRLTLRRLVFRIATHFVWIFGLATRNTSQFPTLYIKLLQVPRNKRGS